MYSHYPPVGLYKVRTLFVFLAGNIARVWVSNFLILTNFKVPFENVSGPYIGYKARGANRGNADDARDLTSTTQIPKPPSKIVIIHQQFVSLSTLVNFTAVLICHDTYRFRVCVCVLIQILFIISLK